jgi:hypothetical protein
MFHWGRYDPILFTKTTSYFVLGDAKSLASRPSHASSDGSTSVTDRRPCYAHAVNTCPTRAAGSSDLRDHAVWLCYWRGLHGVR